MSSPSKPQSTSSTDQRSSLDKNVNFLADEEEWELFKAQVESEGSNASEELRQLMRDRISYDETPDGLRERANNLYEEAGDCLNKADELDSEAESLREQAEAKREEAKTLEDRIERMEREQMSPREQAFNSLVDRLETGEDVVLEGDDDVTVMFEADDVASRGLDGVREWYETLQNDLLESADVTEDAANLQLYGGENE